jgi:hypothetical protein
LSQSRGASTEQRTDRQRQQTAWPSRRDPQAGRQPYRVNFASLFWRVVSFSARAASIASMND